MWGVAEKQKLMYRQRSEERTKKSAKNNVMHSQIMKYMKKDKENNQS